MSNLIHDVIPVPDFLDQIGGNFTGTITISRRFEEHPTAQMRIIVSKQEIDTVRTNLRQNFTTKFLFYNIPFRLRNYNEQEYSQTVYPEGYWEITLDFEGFWKKLVTDPLLLREKAFQGEAHDEWEAPECGVDNTPEALVSGELAHPYKRDVLITYLSTLAERAGIVYDGDGLFAEFPVDASYFATTTLNSELNNLLPTLQKVVKYSKEEGLITQEWDVATAHELGEEEVIGQITFRVNSEKPEYINTELNWDKFGKEEAALEFEQIEIEEVEDTLNNNIPVFDSDIPDVYEIVTGDTGSDLTSPPVDKLASIQMAHDLSGPTATETTTTYEGSNVIQVRELTYGFAFNGIDIFSESGGFGGTSILLGNSAAPYWMPVRDLTTVYEYDSTTGYYLGNRTTGFIRNRFLQDRDESGEAKTSSSGAISYTTKIRDEPDFAQRLEMYQFKKMPYTAETKFELRQFGDYYEDGRNESDQYILYEYCGTDGKLHRGYVLDPTYVEPMFISATDTVIDSVELKRNADLAEQSAVTQYIAKGQESYFSESIEIFQSEFTKANNNLLGKKIKGEGQDRYRRTVITTNTEGEDLRDYKTEQRIEDTQGRPSLATRKPSNFVLRDVTVNNTNATTSVTLARKELERQLKALENLKKQVYFLNTGDNDPSTTAPRGSIFVQTDDRNVAEETAKFNIELQEFRSGEQSTLTTFFNQQLEEGDFLTFTFNGKTRKRRILNVNHIIDIKGTTVDGVTVVTAATQVSMGVISTLGDDVKVTVFDEFGRIVDEDNNNPATDDRDLLDILLPPYYQDKILGGRLRFTSKRSNLIGIG